MTFARVLALLVLASPIAAQPSLGLEYRAMYTDNAVIADPAGLRLSVGAYKGKGAIWFAVERLKEVQRRFGPPCYGFVPPGGCADEPLLDTVSIAGGELGYAYPVTTGPWHRADASLALRVTRFAVRTHSQSGFIVTTDELMLGPELGAEVVFVLPRAKRLGIVAGARLSALARWAPETGCPDPDECYRPITSMRTNALHAGIRWLAKPRSQE